MVTERQRAGQEAGYPHVEASSDSTRRLAVLATWFAFAPYSPTERQGNRSLVNVDKLEDGTKIYAIVKRPGTNTEAKEPRTVIAGYIKDTEGAEVKMIMLRPTDYKISAEEEDGDNLVEKVLSVFEQKNAEKIKHILKKTFGMEKIKILMLH